MRFLFYIQEVKDQNIKLYTHKKESKLPVVLSHSKYKNWYLRSVAYFIYKYGIRREATIQMMSESKPPTFIKSLNL